MVKKAISLFLIMGLCYTLSFAGKLLSRESLLYYNNGVEAQNGENYSEAEAYYQKAILLEAQNLQLLKYILNNRGVIYVAQGDYAKAEATFKEALRIDPEYKPAQLNLGLVYDLNKSKEEALAYWAKVYYLDQLKPKDFVVETDKSKEFW